MGRAGGSSGCPALTVCLSPLQSRLRQTQLRSLSKSDTRLHELYSLKAKNSSECVQSPASHPTHPVLQCSDPVSHLLPADQRPASLDFPLSSLPPDSLHSSVLLHRQLPQIPSSEPTAPDQTYSNLLFAPPHRAPPDTLYECLAMGEDDAPTATGTPASPPPRLGQGAADYACIRKVKKMVPEEQEGAVAEPSAAPQCWEGAGDVPRLKVWHWGGGGHNTTSLTHGCREGRAMGYSTVPSVFWGIGVDP